MADDQAPGNGSTLPWTGERYVPEVLGQVALEHLHRYAFAAALAEGRRVLDIACGEGYGSATLAASALRVTGIDIAQDVVAHAARRYGRQNLAFVRGSCHAIPLAAQSVDLVVSFETLEHVDRHDVMLAEIKRVLRPGGQLIISSPEKSEYSDAVQLSNPFHVRELYDSEFRTLLGAHFRHVAFGGQRIVFGSAILMEDPGGIVRSHSWDGETQSSAPAMQRPRYLIAIASDGPLEQLGGGVFEQPINDSDIIQGWARAVADRDAEIARLRRALAAQPEESSS